MLMCDVTAKIRLVIRRAELLFTRNNAAIKSVGAGDTPFNQRHYILVGPVAAWPRRPDVMDAAPAIRRKISTSPHILISLARADSTTIGNNSATLVGSDSVHDAAACHLSPPPSDPRQITPRTLTQSPSE